jgi:creatinine amidohydrolase
LSKQLVSHCIGDLCYVDIEEHLKESDLVLIPVGSVEQHSKHLPLLTDSYPPLEITKRAAELTNVLYTPIQWYGYTPHHLGWVGKGTGTITLKPKTIMNVYYDIARSLIHHGYNKLIFVTGHASNLKVIDPVLRKIRYDTGAFVMVYKPWVERYIGFLDDVLEGAPEETPGWHASESETSAMMYLTPNLVRMDRASDERAHKPSWLPDSFMKTDGAPDVAFKGYEYFVMSLEHREFAETGVIGNPLKATAKKGEEMIKRFSKHLVDAIEETRKIKVTIRNREFTERADWD